MLLIKAYQPLKTVTRGFYHDFPYTRFRAPCTYAHTGSNALLGIYGTFRQA